MKEILRESYIENEIEGNRQKEGYRKKKRK